VLKAFAPQNLDIELRAQGRLSGSQLHFEYDLKDREAVVLDGLRDGQWKSWSRTDDLWKSTCFEAFVGRRGEPGYWEFNFSPAKQSWNCYRFESYRAPQPPHPSKNFELIEIRIEGGLLHCVLESKVHLVDLECSLSAVIRNKAGVSYWALTHATDKPDFHKRESFSLRL